ncbi:MAG: 1,2-phenylacetyl-CoA epoxidase subunit PaaE [Nakamurella sp.]
MTSPTTTALPENSGPAKPLVTRRRLAFHSLAVAAINRLTADAVEVVFAVPPELAGEFDYLPGQHVAVRLQRDGREIRRSYSLCAPAGNGELHIAVKVEAGGIFSTFANSELAVGDFVEVMTPQGSFTLRPDHASKAHVAAIAAGSGITPIMALATAVLTGAPNTTFTLVYSSRTADQVMFVDELADLKDRFPARLAVHHVLTREQRLSPLHSGRLSPERLDVLFDRLVRPDTIDEWFLCGPVDLVTEVRQQLTSHGVGPIQIHVELFTTGALRRDVLPTGAEIEGATGSATQAGSAANGVIPDLTAGEASVTMTLTGQTATLTCGPDERILDAALKVRADTPFSCTGGVCGTCRARLVSGTVDMEVNFALEPEEIEAGYILTCQAVCTSDHVTVDYDA